MNLSIIIVSWNVKDDLLNCLQSIKENPPSIPFETIVVDNASSDGTVEAIKANYPNVILIANSENCGFVAANNQAIKITKGQYLFLLNPDTIVYKNSIDNLIKVLDEDPHAGACGPKLLDSDGEHCPSIGYIPTFRSLLYRWTFLHPLGIFRKHYKTLTKTHPCYDNKTEVDQLSGSALMIRHSVMDQIGLLDENFFMYYEDVDLCLRIRKAGWKIVYVPDSVITHIGGRSSVQVSAKKKIMLYRSLFIFLRKHRGKFNTWLFSLIFKPGVILKEVIDIVSGTISFLVWILLFDRTRQIRSAARLKNSIIFLSRYSLEFIFNV